MSLSYRKARNRPPAERAERRQATYPDASDVFVSKKLHAVPTAEPNSAAAPAEAGSAASPADAGAVNPRESSADVVQLFPYRHTSAKRSGIRGRLGGSEAGMATAEYAIATLAAVGFAGLLVVILRSDEVRGFLLSIIQQALTL